MSGVEDDAKPSDEKLIPYEEMEREEAAAKAKAEAAAKAASSAAPAAPAAAAPVAAPAPAPIGSQFRALLEPPLFLESVQAQIDGMTGFLVRARRVVL